MLKNYFIIACRNLLKNKLFSLINIVGLGIAIPFALISLMQVQSAYEFDRFHPFPERTYRILTEITDANGVKTSYGSSPYLLAEKLQQDYPAIKKCTKINREFSWDLTNKIKTIRVNALFAEPAFFEIFGFLLEKGNLPLEPKTIALTHEMAEVFFGETDPIGKILSHVDYGDLMVTGVLKPFKKTTHLRSDLILSMATYDQFNKRNPAEPLWSDHDVATYALLHEAT
jgi:putative ABC transport system permease protein